MPSCRSSVVSADPVYGQGYSAPIVLEFALRFEVPIAGLIVSSTMLRLQVIENTSYGGIKIQILKVWGEFFKDFVVNNLENPTALTKNVFNVKKHLDNRVSVPFVGVRFMREFLYTCAYVQDHIRSL